MANIICTASNLYAMTISASRPAAAAAKSLQSCLTLCDPIDGSPPGSPVPGILQASTLEWGCHFLLQCMKVKSESEVAQSCQTLSDPTDCTLPGSCVHGILQARVLEWVAIAFSNICTINSVLFSQSLSCVRLFTTPWTAARKASLSITNSWTCSNSCPSSQ